MKIVQINTFSNGSTGKIMRNISESGLKNGICFYNFFARGNIYNQNTDIKFENKLSVFFHVFLARIGFNGHGSYFATKRLIKKIKNINPDIIHLHNVHGYYLNIKLLINYLKKEYKGKIIWTLHDCWTLTGHCAHFDYVKCNKWQHKCSKCPILHVYPKEIFDTTSKELMLKQKLFSNINNLTIVTPSKWLANIVSSSYMNNYKIKVINNGVDLNIFKKYGEQELLEVYRKYKLNPNDKIILGVANVWEKRKGLSDFIKLSKDILPKYKIIMVGTNNKIDKLLPKNILSIHRTDNQLELAKIYNISKVLFNPTYEDNYPTINLEALACQTPVITYNTGGSPECINSQNGAIVNFEEFKNNYAKISEKKYEFNNEKIDMNIMISEYLLLYKGGE